MFYGSHFSFHWVAKTSHSFCFHRVPIGPSFRHPSDVSLNLLPPCLGPVWRGDLGLGICECASQSQPRNSRSAEAMFLRAGKFALLNGALVMEEHVPQWEWRLDPSPNSQSEPATQRIVACQPPPDLRRELTPPADTETSSLETDRGPLLDGLPPPITRA